MCFKWLKKVFDPIYRMTDDESILESLKLLDNNIIDSLCEKSVKIKWHDLNNFDGYTKYAIRAIDFSGNNYILLNNMYKKAPKEQIACLIAHESVHIKQNTDINEELQATITEAITWLYLKNKDTKYEKSPLYTRLEAISVMNREQIRQYIISNKLYESTLVV